MKQIACGDLIPGCNFIAEAETEQELLQKVAAHVKNDHRMEVTPALVDQIKGKIRER